MNQHEALRLADRLDSKNTVVFRTDAEAASTELRRLHAENEALRKDAERYQAIKENALLGFQGASGWNAVLTLPITDAEHTTLDLIVDAMKGQS